MFALLGSPLLAQNLRWEAGVFLGGSTYQGDLIKTDLYDFGEFNFGYGLLLRHNIHPNLSLRANLMRGKITGDDMNYEDRQGRGFNLSSPITEVSAMLEIDILGHKRYKDGKFKRMISPYVFGGLGLSWLDQDIFYNENLTRANSAELNRDKNANLDKAWFAVPFGLGLKADLSEKWTLGVEWGTRPVFSDLLDGVSQTGNPDENDWYNFGGATLVYRFGEADSDGDGIKDNEDSCPTIPGVESANGCPDTDSDGIRDSNDDCPEVAGVSKFNGCPDTDGDNIVDSKDDCPNERGTIENGGCPVSDQDADGIPDDEDDCPLEAGEAADGGCPDTDKDGIINRDDACPTEAGTAATNGCPDSDRDGIIDSEDRCPDVAGSADMGGCADSDGDGIADIDDKCPDAAGDVGEDGCPELTAEEEDVLEFATQNVFFETNSATIKRSSYNILDQIAEIMDRHQNYDLRMEGYTDNRGNDFANQQLSEKRAQSCFEYLENKGIATGRMSFKGFGENKPIGNNNTVEGRAQNRRVEFHLDKQN